MSKRLTDLIQLYRDAYSGHPKEIWALVVLTVINRTGTMVLPFLSVYTTTELSFSLKDAGILASAFGLGSLAGTFLAGKIIDKSGARLVILVSLFMSGILFMLLQFATTFYPLFGMIFLTSMFGESYRPAMSKMVGDYVPKSATGRSMALIRLAINLGMSAAPAIGGFVAIALGYHWLFWIDGITCILGAVYFAIVSQSWEHRIQEAPEIGAIDLEKSADIEKSFTHKNYLLFLLATFLMSFSFLQLFHTVPVFIKEEWGFDERYIGTLLAVSSIMVVVIEMPLVHVTEGAKKVPKAMLTGLFLLGICYLVFLFPPALIWCFVAVIFWTMGEILVLPFNNTIPINMSPPGKQGQYFSWYFMTWSFANVLAPIVGFAIADSLGFSSLWIGLALMMAISWVITSRNIGSMIPD